MDFTKKKGYEEQMALRSRYFKNVEVIDEDHLYVPKGKTTNRLLTLKFFFLLEE